MHLSTPLALSLFLLATLSAAKKKKNPLEVAAGYQPPPGAEHELDMDIEHLTAPEGILEAKCVVEKTRFDGLGVADWDIRQIIYPYGFLDSEFEWERRLLNCQSAVLEWRSRESNCTIMNLGLRKDTLKLPLCMANPKDKYMVKTLALQVKKEAEFQAQKEKTAKMLEDVQDDAHMASKRPYRPKQFHHDKDY